MLLQVVTSLLSSTQRPQWCYYSPRKHSLQPLRAAENGADDLTPDTVFYNRVGEANRDLSMLLGRQLMQTRLFEYVDGTPFEFSVLDGHTASGIRAIRYGTEVPGVTRIVANDIDPNAVECAQRAISQRRLMPERCKFEFCTGDLIDLLYANRNGGQGTFDIIDLDPYGTAAPYLDGACCAVKAGGMLAVSCTDMPVLTGVQPEAAWTRYGSYAPRSGYGPESSLRVLLHALEAAAARQNRHIEPLLSIGMDHWVRCFVRVHRGRRTGHTQSALVLQSSACASFSLVPFGASEASLPSQCPETSAPMIVCGPIWSGQLHNLEWVDRLITDLQALIDSEANSSGDVALLRVNTANRLLSLLQAVASELPHSPLYMRLSELNRSLGLAQSLPWGTMAAALEQCGYAVSAQHRDPLAVKTDAPCSVAWDVMRLWAQQHPPPQAKQGEWAAASAAILAQQPSVSVDFEAAAVAGAAHQKLRERTHAFAHLHPPEAGFGPKKKPAGATNLPAAVAPPE